MHEDEQMRHGRLGYWDLIRLSNGRDHVRLRLKLRRLRRSLSRGSPKNGYRPIRVFGRKGWV